VTQRLTQCGPRPSGPDECCGERIVEEANMSVLIYVLLTVAIFGLLGLIQKLVEDR
jgi:hypothetical protein